MKAYIFLNLKQKEKLEDVVPKEGVVEFTRLTGEFDGLIIVDLIDPYPVIREIRKNPLVSKTVTFISLN